MRPVLFIGILLASAVSAQKPVVGLISMDDYPPEALARGEEGTVKVKLRISREGRAVGCSVIQSATQALDAATCYVMMRRAKFTPAQNETGAAAEDDYDATITWKIQDQKENRKNNSTRM